MGRGKIGHICDGLVFAMGVFFCWVFARFQLTMMAVGYFL